jgi:transcriptional regulator with XRE-family HTH domain
MLDGMTTRPTHTGHVVRENVEALMRLHNQTQADLAKGIRMSQGTISRKLAWKTDISLNDLDMIARHFRITVADLVTPGLPCTNDRPAWRPTAHADGSW